jgi:hypothetical protein
MTAVGEAMAATAVEELELVIDQLRDTQWPAEVFDDELRLVWVSDAMRDVLGDPSEEDLGYGNHILLARLTGAAAGYAVRNLTVAPCPTARFGALSRIERHREC